jgi:hypothetical protein
MSADPFPGLRRWQFLPGALAAIACAFLLTGCGGADDTKPAPVNTELQKKTQDYLNNYRQQMIEANKGKAKPSTKPR